MVRDFLWAIFGNNDDWPPPAHCYPELPDWKRRGWWLIRNPLHNFTFYVIGVADKEYYFWGKTWGKGWNFAYIEYSWLLLPFVSYRGKSIEGYIGWRDRGNFGISLRPSKSKGY